MSSNGNGSSALTARDVLEAGDVLDKALAGVAEASAGRIAEIYDEVLSLEPDPDWKPSTKLNFRSQQLREAERLLNRVQGMPVQRQRQLEGADEHKSDFTNLPAPVVERMLQTAMEAAFTAGRHNSNGDGVIETTAREIEQGDTE